MLRTPIGRVRRFGEASAVSRRERNEVRRQAKNFPIQGCCADGLKLPSPCLGAEGRVSRHGADLRCT